MRYSRGGQADLIGDYKQHKGRREISSRLTCRHCRRWRPCVDFSVRKWNKARTRPLHLRPDCDRCAGVIERTRTRIREAREEQARVKSILSLMSCEERHEYELEGCLPIIARGLVLEDLDPVPVPTGCPGCWKRDGGLVCDTCPDVEAKQKRQDDIRAGRVERKILMWA